MRKCVTDKVVRYEVHDLVKYINWSYFYHAWGFPHEYASAAHVHDCAACRSSWVRGFAESEQPKAVEALNLYADAREQLGRVDNKYGVNALFMLFEANSDGDDILLGEHRLPMLRQQVVSPDGYCYCMSDFVRPARSGKADLVGVFATSADAEMVPADDKDDYVRLLLQTLADRLAEAAAEKLHEQVRKELWGYAPEEDLSVAEMHVNKFQGIRAAVGYPCMPDISLNMLLDGICRFDRIGVTLTEHGMMCPHASVSGLMISHPQSKYFSVGLITEEQVVDYALRRGMDVVQMRKFLAGNLAYDSGNLAYDYGAESSF